MKYQLLAALSLLFLTASVADAAPTENVTIPAQTSIEISVVENVNNLYEWQLICYQNGNVEGSHPEGKKACGEIAQLKVPIGEAIGNAVPIGICPTVIRSTNFTIHGIVDSKKTLFNEMYANSCMLKHILSAAKLPTLVPFTAGGRYNTHTDA